MSERCRCSQSNLHDFMNHFIVNVGWPIPAYRAPFSGKFKQCVFHFLLPFLLEYDLNVLALGKAVGYTIRKRTEIKRKDGVDVSETTVETNTWILSRKMTAKEFGWIARGHWAIENKLHGVTDYSFREDWSTARKDNAIENLAQMRKICYNFMTLDPAVSGMTKKKAFNYYRRNTDGIIRLIFTEIPKSEHPES